MFNKEYLKKVLSIQSHSYEDALMVEFLTNELNALQVEFPTMKLETDTYGNIYVTKGTGIVSGKNPKPLYNCAVSHIDTVHRHRTSFDIFETSRGVLFAYDGDKCEQAGIGGDDKVGVYICLQLLKSYDNIKCVFFKDEEVGCVGSGNAVVSWFDDCMIMLQSDRRGSSDFIIHTNGVSVQSKSFRKAVAPLLEVHDYKEAYGTLTDIGELKTNGVNICAANVSSGYYNAHSDDEYVVVNEVEKCLNLFVAIFDTLGYKKWQHKAEREYVGFGHGNSALKGSYYGRSGSHRSYPSSQKKSTHDHISTGGSQHSPASSPFGRSDSDIEGICPICNVHTLLWDNHDNQTSTCQNCFEFVKKEDIVAVQATVEYEDDAIDGVSIDTIDTAFCVCQQKYVPAHNKQGCEMCKTDYYEKLFGVSARTFN